MKFEDIQKVNETIKTIDVKGKGYAEVNQRIKAFRMLYPDGFIKTEMLSNEDGVCIFKATVGYVLKTLIDDKVYIDEIELGTGTAYEKENSTFINKTSYIENCETSAVGRALAMCGIGIDTSVASAEEVQNAIANQDNDINDLQLEIELQELIVKTGTDVEKLLANYGKPSTDKLTTSELKNAIAILKKKLTK